MSARPSERAAFAAVYRLLLRCIATPGRIVAVSALAGLSVLTAVVVHINDPGDPLREGTGWVSQNLTTVVPVGILVFAVATLGDLQDDGSLVYLWLRPVPTRVHVLAAWCATLTVTTPLLALPILLSAAVIEPDGSLLAGTLVSVAVASAAYAAMFVTVGIRFRRALPWGLVYILLWEGFVARAGEGAAKLALRSYVGSILSEMTGIPIRLAEYTLASGIIVPVVVAALALRYAARRLARTDIA